MGVDHPRRPLFQEHGEQQHWEDRYGTSPLQYLGRQCYGSSAFLDRFTPTELVALARQTDAFDRTVLHYVASGGGLADNQSGARCIATLIDAGADVDAASETGKTPLIHAAQSLNGHATQALIEAGADVNASDHYGRTALMFAIAAGAPGIVEDLLEAGADKFQSTIGGMDSAISEPGDFFYSDSVDAIAIAEEYRNENIMKLLEE